MTTGSANMGRTKADPPGQPRREHVIVVKGRAEWGEWARGGARHCRMSISECVEVALASYFKAEGYAEKMPRR